MNYPRDLAIYYSMWINKKINEMITIKKDIDTLNSILFFMIEWWNEMIDENKMN